jgi:outer membrane protein W
VSAFNCVLRRGAIALCALLAVSVLAVSPLLAADAAAPAPVATKAAKADKAKARKDASAGAKAAKVAKAEKARPAKAPEKSPEEQRKADGIWAKRTNWLSLRAGYAKSTVDNSGDGLVGYGFGYQHMLSRKWSLGGGVQHDLLGRLGSSTEISVPFTLELARHYKWNTAIRPYLGVGGGYYFHKYYRTPYNDTGAPGSGYYVTVGANMPLSDRSVLGLDARTSFVDGRNGAVNSVFGAEKASQRLWSVKLTWGIVYF